MANGERKSPLDRVGLEKIERIDFDVGLCLLTVQLTVYEALAYQALSNNGERVELYFRLGGGQPTEFSLSA